MSALDTNTAMAILRENFAPWVLDLDLSVAEISPHTTTVLLPRNDRLSRIGGMVCGQALVSAADTAMVLALCGAFGKFKPVGTVDLTTCFMRPLSGEDARIQASVMRVGRTMAFCSASVVGADSGKPCVFCTGTYAVPN